MNHTRAAIINAFWQLLDEKPYNKITVKNIVERCQVNRNTFYYHFHDIPELLETIIKERADAIIHTHYKLGSPLDCILPLIQYSTERKNAILHIYHSLHREIFLDHLNRIALYIVKEYVDTLSTTILLSAEDQKLLVRFYPILKELCIPQTRKAILCKVACLSQNNVWEIPMPKAPGPTWQPILQVNGS